LFDAELSAPVKKWLERNGVTVHLGASARSLVTDKGGHVLAIQTQDGRTEHLPADKILVTVGRKPNTMAWGLENMAIEMDGRFVRVDDRCRTSMRNVWAIGDLVGEPLLAHKAMAQGEMVAEIIAGERRRFDPVAIAAVCFTEPEIVVVGLGPADPAIARQDTISATFPFAANGRSLTMDAGEEGGFVRVLARRDDHRIVGIQAVGAHISELAGEFSLALEMGAVLEDIAGTIHAHPTLGEAFHETALRTLGHALHI
jgi:dihydrolipoamide dehydrogenase